MSHCNNWWEITFLSAPSKILAKIIIRYISEEVDQRLRKEHAGLQKRWGCTGQILTLCNATEQRCRCTWILKKNFFWTWSLKRLSTASSENIYGASSGWNFTTDHPSNQELLKHLQEQSRKQRIQLQCENWCLQGCYKLALLFNQLMIGWCSKQHRTNHEHQVDPLFNLGRSGLLWWPSAGLTHSPAFPRENQPTQHICTASEHEEEMMMLNVLSPTPVKVNEEYL